MLNKLISDIKICTFHFLIQILLLMSRKRNRIIFIMFLTYFSDPRTNEWPLVQGITSTLACVIVYLYVVLYLGPKLMENRKAYNLLPIIKVYNIIQLIACVLIFYMESIIWTVYYFPKQKCNILHYNFRFWFLAGQRNILLDVSPLT